ncbi:MAG: DUF655 domain-containing protein [Zestosphaera sp.]
MGFKGPTTGDKRVSREDFAVVLDFMPGGNPLDQHHPSHKNKPVAQALGTTYFTLLESHPKPGVAVTQGEKVCVSFRFRELRDKVGYVWGESIRYDDLTTVAKSYLPEAIKIVVLDLEKVFVTFFNIAAPVTIKLHSLELIPGIGKKTMWTILEERKKPFESFRDIQARVKIPDPVGLISERILKEIKGEEKIYLFLEPPPGVRDAVVLGYLHRIYSMLGYE